MWMRYFLEEVIFIQNTSAPITLEARLQEQVCILDI